MERDKLLNLLPGASSATTSVLIGYPIDTIKTRMQTNMYKNFFECLFKTYGNEGIGAFYRGVSMPFTTLLFKRSLQFYIYERSKENNNSWIAGAKASLISPLSNPMHVIKIKMQNSKEDQYKNVRNLCKNILRTEGVLGFSKGIFPNLIKDILFGTVYLGSYGQLQKSFSNLENRVYINFLAGGTSGCLAWGILMPVDYLKTTYQSGNNFSYIKNQISQNGIKVLWKGVVPSVLRIFPINALAMTVYEFTKHKIKKV